MQVLTQLSQYFPTNNKYKTIHHESWSLRFEFECQMFSVKFRAGLGQWTTNIEISRIAMRLELREASVRSQMHSRARIGL